MLSSPGFRHEPPMAGNGSRHRSGIRRFCDMSHRRRPTPPRRTNDGLPLSCYLYLLSRYSGASRGYDSNRNNSQAGCSDSPSGRKPFTVGGARDGPHRQPSLAGPFADGTSGVVRHGMEGLAVHCDAGSDTRFLANSPVAWRSRKIASASSYAASSWFRYA
jgi:hypothetical protein